MARRKKAKKTTTHERRRRVSGIGSGLGHEAMEVIGLVAGNIGATVMQRQLTSMNPKVVSGGQIVAGFLLKKHAKTPFMQGISYGLMSAGAIGITHEFGLIHGVEDFVAGLYGGGERYLEEQSDMRGIANSDTMTGVSNGSMMTGAGNDFNYMNM